MHANETLPVLMFSALRTRLSKFEKTKTWNKYIYKIIRNYWTRYSKLVKYTCICRHSGPTNSHHEKPLPFSLILNHCSLLFLFQFFKHYRHIQITSYAVCQLVSMHLLTMPDNFSLKCQLITLLNNQYDMSDCSLSQVISWTDSVASLQLPLILIFEKVKHI